MNDKLEALKLFMEMFAGAEAKSQGAGSLAGRAVGKYVIVRSRNEGINAGLVTFADGTGVILSNARRLWHHRPKVVSESWYEGVSNHGLSDDSRVSAPVTEKLIIESYSMTVCTEIARQSIESAATYAQS